MANDFLTTYKYGWKTSYYQNTYDAKKDVDEPAHPIGWKDDLPEKEQSLDELINELAYAEEDCDSCKV